MIILWACLVLAIGALGCVDLRRAQRSWSERTTTEVRKNRKVYLAGK